MDNRAGIAANIAKHPFVIAVILASVALALVALTISRSPRPPQGPSVAEEAEKYVRYRKAVPLSEPLTQLLSNPDLFVVEPQKHPLLGKKAPNFQLAASDGRLVRLETLLAQGPVVVIFYYGYYCSHCVAQLFSIDEDLARFRELGASVVAISPDSVTTTRERIAENNRGFGFPLLADPYHEVAKQYGVYTPAEGKTPEDLQHGTFIVDRSGIVRWSDVGDQPFIHNQTLLYELAKIEGRLPKEASPRTLPAPKGAD